MQANFSVRNVYGDHMVLQREQPIRIAGSAPAGSSVNVQFAGRSLDVVADADANWDALFPAMTAGGPYELTVTSQAGAVVTFRDILVGEVWLCSGQSNMEFNVLCDRYFYSLRDGKEVAENAQDNKLRLFQVQRAFNPDGTCADAPAGCAWKPATTPEAVKPFSAIGYWFGVFLRQKFGDVPVGMINASWGGTRIEPWISHEAYVQADRQHELKIVKTARKFDTQEEVKKRLIAEMLPEFEAWLAKFNASDPAMTAEALAAWAQPGIDLAAWKQGPLAALKALREVGVAWYRHEVEIPADWAGCPVVVHVDAISDCDETFFDGLQIGSTSYDTPNYWAVPRNYTVPAETAGPGRHVVAIRVSNHFSEGGMQGKAWLSCEGDTRRIDLNDGVWAKRCEFAADTDAIGIRPPSPGDVLDSRISHQTPTTLYNAMIHPFTVLNLRGFIWYQGCSNTSNPQDYRVLQPLLIDNWRQAWNNPEAAFIITQLSAFERHDPENRLPDDYWREQQPHESGYSLLREVQDELRSYPNTGMAVTIDIGDHSDIHPSNKKDVAYRLAKQAERLCYGNTGIVEGPHYAAKTVEGDKIRISFTNVGEGLVARDGAVGEHSFAIAGADGNYVWAEAKIDGDTVVVWSPEVSEPVDVRYAWSMCPPNPNLYNAEGFPMCPFRTDAD
jgi:sialate O-acetylesterase